MGPLPEPGFMNHCRKTLGSNLMLPTQDGQVVHILVSCFYRVTTSVKLLVVVEEVAPSSSGGGDLLY